MSDGEPVGRDGAASDGAAGRSTRQKRALAAILDRTDSFQTAQELWAALESAGNRVGLTTVYNQLRVLADAGEVDALRAEDGQTLYRRCRTDAHHHHLLCRVCGRTVEIDSLQLERWTDELAAAEGFSDTVHTLEIVGTCRECANAPAT